ncbi:MAG: ABC transporter ATP-binding protein [Acidimicrobiales bacterium]
MNLRLEQVAVRYGRREVVSPCDLMVDEGEWLGVIGPNGAGKSSLLKAICGLVSCRGSVVAGDIDLLALSPRDRAKVVAVVPQAPIVPDDMTVVDYVLLGRTAYAGRFGLTSRRDRAVVSGVVDELDLGRFTGRRLGELSGGERQRVVLARALAQEAPILVLDEPTSALDIGHQQQALELVARLRGERRLTVLSAMHDLTLAGTYADRLALLDDGAVVAHGTPVEVLTAERVGAVFRVCVSVDVDPDDGAVIVVPRRGFPATDPSLAEA